MYLDDTHIFIVNGTPEHITALQDKIDELHDIVNWESGSSKQMKETSSSMRAGARTPDTGASKRKSQNRR